MDNAQSGSVLNLSNYSILYFITFKETTFFFFLKTVKKDDFNSDCFFALMYWNIQVR